MITERGDRGCPQAGVRGITAGAAAAANSWAVLSLESYLLRTHSLADVD